MNKKNIFLIILAIFLQVTFIGCGGGGSSNEEKDPMFAEFDPQMIHTGYWIYEIAGTTSSECVDSESYEISPSGGFVYRLNHNCKDAGRVVYLSYDGYYEQTSDNSIVLVPFDDTDPTVTMTMEGKHHMKREIEGVGGEDNIFLFSRNNPYFTMIYTESDPIYIFENETRLIPLLGEISTGGTYDVSEDAIFSIYGGGYFEDNILTAGKLGKWVMSADFWGMSTDTTVIVSLPNTLESGTWRGEECYFELSEDRLTIENLVLTFLIDLSEMPCEKIIKNNISIPSALEINQQELIFSYSTSSVDIQVTFVNDDKATGNWHYHKYNSDCGVFVDQSGTFDVSHYVIVDSDTTDEDFEIPDQGSVTIIY